MEKHKIFEPYYINESLKLKNRIVMAPYLLKKGLKNACPPKSLGGFYSRRCQSGLIITEATMVSSDASGYPRTIMV